MVLDTLKKQLHDTANPKGGKWIKELPNHSGGFVHNLLLGNSGKPVTLETLSLTKFSKHVFQGGREFTIFGSLEPVEPRIRECAKFGDLDSMKKWGLQRAEARSLELSMARTSEDGRFGNVSRAKFGSCARGHARTGREVKANSGIY
jgi:hypothetical protein